METPSGMRRCICDRGRALMAADEDRKLVTRKKVIRGQRKREREHQERIGRTKKMRVSDQRLEQTYRGGDPSDPPAGWWNK